MSELKLLYITAGSLEEAKRLGRLMVERELAACANVIPGMHSVYRWQGKLCEDEEVVLLIKTSAERVDALIEAVVEEHSYECPCVLVLPIETGYAGYMEWLRAQAAGVSE